MRRLPPLEIALLVALVPLWLAGLAIHVDLVLDQRLSWVPIYVTPAGNADDAPRLRGFWPEVPREEDATALRPGDLLLRVGDADLRGAGRVEVLARTWAASYATSDDRPWGEAARAVDFEVLREGRVARATLALQAVAFPWRTVPIVVAMALTGVIALVRGRASRAARLYGVAAFAFSLHWCLLLGSAAPGVNAAGLGLLFLTGTLYPPLVLIEVLVFPESIAPRSRRALLWPWVFALLGPALSSWLLGVPLSGEIGLRLVFALNLVWFAVVLALLARSYARADAVGRRQLRWVLYGFYVGLAPVAAAAGAAAVEPGLRTVYEVSHAAVALIPLFILVAIVRYNLLDIDRLITATAAYSILSVVFLAALFTLLPALARATSDATGVEPATAQIGLALVLAILLLRAERYVRPRLERIFFRERHDLERGVRELRAEIGHFPGPGPLLSALGERLQKLLALDTCVLYGKAGDAFAPVFSSGPIVPPGFDAAGTLVALLEEAGEPVDAARWRRWLRRARIGAADGAALESLGATLLLPITRGEELAAFACLSEKGSGDVYTPVDVTLLDGLADRVSLELRRYDEAVIESAERELHRRLAGYVPAAVVDELKRHRAIESGTRDASVLFVDIRGYTALSESRDPDEIFRVVNAYTTAVSGVVQAHGGSVVEFHGDGLLAVFGAPTPLPEKERAAVGAALAIVDTVEGRGIEGLETPLRVGVGVATGEVFCGDIQSIDRRIWSVIGNTTNLAARLESLSKEYDATVVIDAATRAGAGDAVRGFAEHAGVRIRGRSEPQSIHVLARGAVV